MILALGAGCAATSAAGPGSATKAVAGSPPEADASRSEHSAGNPAALRAMTFNIRYGTATDGADAWPLRRDLALRVMRDFDAHVLGLQEALRFQLDEIAKALPQYGEIGVGRDDGVRAGEYAAILYDRRRLTPLDQGRFWLSDTPDVPGSMTWGNHYPRIVTWARFTDRVREKSFYVFNTHWDHESQHARERGAVLLMEHIKARAATGDPVLLLGDFNGGLNNPAFQTLLEPLGIEPLGESPVNEALTDTFRARYPGATDRIGTFHSFRGHREGDKIDAVLASRAWQVLDADIVHVSENGRYPSDHFPVTATLLLPPDPPPPLVMPSARAPA